MSLEIRDIDRRIWEEELESFVPKRLFDAHAHIYLAEHDLSRQSGSGPYVLPPMPQIDYETLTDCYARLFPGREVHSVLFGWVFRDVDFRSINAFTSRQAERDPFSVPFMLVSPSMTAAELADAVDRSGFVGLKPYFYWSDKLWDAGILDFLPEPLIEVADDRHLAVTLHLGKRDAIADKENIDSLRYLTRTYPNVRWILAHCARSLAPWPLERAIDHIKELPNLWYDISSVSDPYVYLLMLRNVPIDRILYGSDIPSDLERGNLVSFGYAWALLAEQTIRSMEIPHCYAEPTYVVYETLRAFRRAARERGLSAEDVEGVFLHNALSLFNLER